MYLPSHSAALAWLSQKDQADELSEQRDEKRLHFSVEVLVGFF